jgi:hypothetical protein
MNRVLEEMLRNYVAQDQSNWVSLLPMAQFAINNSWQESVKHSPFFLNHGRHPRMPSSSITLPTKVNVPKAKDFVANIHEAIARAKKCLRAAQDRQRQYADQRRRPATYAKGQMVWLNTKNLRRKKDSAKKLMPRWIGPFEVAEMVGKAAVRLHLSIGFERIHDVFHVSLVKPYIARPGEQVVQAQPLPWLDDEGEPSYQVDAILAHQFKPVTQGRGKHKSRTQKYRITAYLVRWFGYNDSHNTWEPPENFDNCVELLRQYRETCGLLEPQWVH